MDYILKLKLRHLFLKSSYNSRYLNFQKYTNYHIITLICLLALLLNNNFSNIIEESDLLYSVYFNVEVEPFNNNFQLPFLKKCQLLHHDVSSLYYFILTMKIYK